MKNEHELYMKGAHGINTWKVYSDDNIIFIHANGSYYKEAVELNLSGRSLAQQVELRVNARVRSKLDQGFKRSIEEANKGITNQLGLASPMLASQFKNAKNIKPEDLFVQPKLDGHRCLINNKGAYSRRGKPIETIPEIVDSLYIPEGITLDGELYHHGTSLQTIGSWAKRRQSNTRLLEYHVYDIIDEELPTQPYESRMRNLLEIFSFDVNKNNTRIVMVETEKFDSQLGALGHCYRYRNKGYEGAILRNKNGIYEIGKRSKNLIKVKVREDKDYECIDIIPSREGWGILVLQNENKKQFKTLAPGSVWEKIRTLDKKDSYIGRYVTCEYADMTDDNIPFHCVAIRWKTDL